MEKTWEAFDELHDIGVTQISLEGVVTRCNNAFAAMLDEDKMYIVGENIVDLTAPDDRERVRTSIIALAAGAAASIRHEKRYMKRDGSVVLKMLHTVLIHTNEGKYLLSFVYDMATDQLEGQVERLEELLVEAFAAVSKSTSPTPAPVEINVTGSDQSTNTSADNGGTATVTTSGNKIPAIVYIMLGLFIVMATLGVVALVVGGKLTLQHGDTKLNVNEPPPIKSVE